MAFPKLIAVDLDGTFFDKHQQVNAHKFTKLLDYLDERDYHFVAATGNDRATVDRFLVPFVGRFDYVVQNGGQVITKDNKELALHSLSREHMEIAMKAVAESPLSPGHGNVYSTATNGYMLRADKGQGELYHHMVAEFPNLIFIDSLDEITEPVVKIIVNWPEVHAETFMAQLNRELAGTAHVTTSGFGMIDIVAPNINKAVGLQELGAYYGIEPAEMAAFGDGGNDIEMLRLVGHPFAMTNAAQPLLDEFPPTVSDNNHDGVLDTIGTWQ